MSVRTVKPSDLFKVRRRIQQLREAQAASLPDDAKQALLKRIMTGSNHAAITLQNRELFRARWNKQGEQYTNVRELIYPPSEFSRRGRFNRDGQSIFYAASSELGTIIELRPELGKLFTISRFSLHDRDNLLVFPLGIKTADGIEERYLKPRNKAESLVRDFLHEIVTLRSGSPGAYDLSNLLSDMMLGVTTKSPSGGMISTGLAYASVEASYIANQPTYNIALTPTLYARHCKFRGATTYCLTFEGTHYQLNPVNQATSGDNGELAWRFTLEEMTVRIREGLLDDGKYCESLKDIVP